MAVHTRHYRSSRPAARPLIIPRGPLQMIDATQLLRMSSAQPITRWEAGVVRAESDELAEEEPLEVRVRGRAISVTMRTPGHDDELAAGFLLTEGVIARAEHVLAIEPCERNDAGNLVNVRLAPDVVVDFEKLSRHVFASSSCGL